MVFPTWGGGTLPILELKLGKCGTRASKQNVLNSLLGNLSDTSKLLAMSYPLTPLLGITEELLKNFRCHLSHFALEDEMKIQMVIL